VALRSGRVAELPTPKPGKPLPERRALMLWIEDAEGRVLMQRRPPTGIWGSLWSLPEHADHETARTWFAEHIAGDFDAAETLAPVAHGFTHYRLQIQPLRWRGARPDTAARDNAAPAPTDLRWTPRDALAALGLPAPVRKLLDT
jgi:A/G-specific adenine glycosylase